MFNMKTLSKLLKKSEHSQFQLWLLNRFMLKIIPFNAQHGILITRVTPDSLETYIRFKKRNLNHIRGIHACALATIGEFSSGMLLLHALDMGKYRLILSHLSVDYHYQAKQASKSIAVLPGWEREAVIQTLEKGEPVLREMISTLYDAEERHVATVKTLWQIKPWSLVKTKV